MAMKRVTIFGGSGFIGRHIVKRLAQRELVVRAAVRDPERALFLKPMGAVGQIVPVAADVRDETSVAAAVSGADAVINAVSLYAEKGGATFGDVHVRGAAIVARRAAAEGAARLVHLSGIGVDPKSESSYVRARFAGEEAVRKENPGAVILRPGAAFGPDDSLMTALAAAARLAPAMPLFDGGKAKIQPVYVGDIAEAASRALDEPDAVGQIFELGGPGVYDYRELTELLLKAIGRKRLLVSVPSGLGKLMAFFAGFLPNPPLTRDAITLMTHDTVVAPGAKGLADLGIVPTALEMVLPTYMDRYRRGGRWKRAHLA
jgi:NADH dehydrogenase